MRCMKESIMSNEIANKDIKNSEKRWLFRRGNGSR